MPIFKKIFSLWVAKRDGYYFVCISLLYKVFAMLQKQTYLPEKQYKKIKPAIDYINENFTNGKLSVGKLSAICGISESALKKLFIKKFGVPPVRYIIQLKINYSCDLLRSGLYSVSRVSQICGYGNVYFFSRQFKENMGISPSEFLYLHIFCRAPNVFCAVRGDFFQNKRQTVTFFRFFDILLLRADGERIYRRDAKCEGKEAAAATRDLWV